MDFYEVVVEAEIRAAHRYRDELVAVLKFPKNCPYPTREEVLCLLIEMGTQIRNPHFSLDEDQLARERGMTHVALITSGDDEYQITDEYYFPCYPTKEMMDAELLGHTPLCNQYTLNLVREL